MLAFDDIPPPAGETTVALLGLAVVFWFFARIQIIRRQLGRGMAPADVPRSPAWLVRLASWRPVYGALAVAALAFAGLLAWSLSR